MSEPDVAHGQPQDELDQGDLDAAKKAFVSRREMLKSGAVKAGLLLAVGMGLGTPEARSAASSHSPTAASCFCKGSCGITCSTDCWLGCGDNCSSLCGKDGCSITSAPTGHEHIPEEAVQDQGPQVTG